MSIFAFAVWGACWFITTFVAVATANSLLQPTNRLHLVEVTLVLSNTALFITGLSIIY